MKTRRLQIWAITTVTALVACAPSMQLPKDFSPSQAQSLVDKGAIYLEARELDKSEAAFKLAQQFAPSAAAVDGLGCVEFLKGNYKKAKKLFLDAYEMDNTYYNSLGNLALLYEVTGDKRKALEIYERYLKIEPSNSRARNNFAAMLFEQSPSLKRPTELLNQAALLYPHPIVQRNIHTVMETEDNSFGLKEDISFENIVKEETK